MEESAGERTIFLDEVVFGDMWWSRMSEVKLEDQDGDCKASWRAVGFRGHGTATEKGNGFMRSDKDVPAWRAKMFVSCAMKGLGTTSTGENKEGMR